MSRLQPGDQAPPFRGLAVRNGEIAEFTLDDALKGYQYLLMVFYPADFTFVCPTEITQFMDKWSEFSSQQCNIVCCSTDSAFTHFAWLKAAKTERGLGNPERPSIVLLSDRTREVSESYGVLAEGSGLAYRATFLIGADKRIYQVTVNDMPVGRSVDEALRMLNDIQSGGGQSDAPGGAAINGFTRRSCSRPRMPDLQMQLPPTQAASFQFLQQQWGQQYQQCSQLDSAQPFPVAFQCEPQTFIVGKPVCSGLAVEAASLETQAAQLRVKDSEDRLAWMITESDRLRQESERLRSETERLKVEARRRQMEAERLVSCHTVCQAATGGVPGGSKPTIADDCSWSAPAAGISGRQQQQQQQHFAPMQPPPPPPPPQSPPHHCRPPPSCSQQPMLRRPSHVCRHGANSMASHIAGSKRC